MAKTHLYQINSTYDWLLQDVFDAYRISESGATIMLKKTVRF